VLLDRLLTEVELRPNLAIGTTLRHQRRHLALATREDRKLAAFVRRARGRGRGPRPLAQPPQNPQSRIPVTRGAARIPVTRRAACMQVSRGAPRRAPRP
jgi:hypothetical protein